MKIFIFTSGITSSNCIIMNKLLKDESIIIDGIYFSLPQGGDHGFFFKFKRLFNYGVRNLIKIAYQKFIYSNNYEEKTVNTFKKLIKDKQIKLFYRNDFEICLEKAKANSNLAILVYFNKIIKRKYISKKLKIINIHPSYLPDYKGVQPVFWSLYNNESTMGISMHLVDSGIDSGPVYKQIKVPTKTNSVNVNMFNISKIFSDKIIKIIKMIEDNKIFPKHQIKKKGKYYSRPNKTEIDFFLKYNKYF